VETPNDSLLRTDKDSEKYGTLTAKFVGAYVVYSRIVRRITFSALGSLWDPISCSLASL